MVAAESKRTHFGVFFTNKNLRKLFAPIMGWMGASSWGQASTVLHDAPNQQLAICTPIREGCNVFRRRDTTD